MTPTDPSPGDDTIHRPRTVVPGGSPSGPVVIRPRTIAAMGRPKPLPPIVPVESFVDPAYQPPTGQVPVVYDPELWTIDEPATAAEAAPATAATAAARSAPDASSGGPSAADTAAAEAAAGGGRLLRNNLLVASGTAASRITGLARTALIYAFLFKTLGDTYLLANNTPNIIYELILGGVLTATLVPIFTDDLENGDGDATSAVMSFTIVALVALTLFTAAASPGLMWLYSRGSPAAARANFLSAGVRLAILFAPQVFFYGLMALWSAVLNARHRFFAAAWAPVLNNLLVIGVLLATYHQVDGKPTVKDLLHRPSLLLLLGLGTTAGIALMTLSLYPALRASGMRLKFKFSTTHPAVRRAVRLSAWTFGYVIANQVAGVVVSVLAKPASGGVRDYQTAFQFFQLPHGLLAVSIMTTFEPMLGRAQARDDQRTFNQQLLLGFRLIGLLIIPATIGYIALPVGLSRGIQPHTGTVHDLLSLGGIVAAFAVGLPGFSTYLYSLRGFYAKKDTRTPFWINCAENVVNIVAAVILVHFFDVVGLALAYAIAYSVAAVISVTILSRRSDGFDVRGLLLSWAKLLLAGLIMGGFVFGMCALIAPTTVPLLVATVGLAIALGAVTYFGAIYALDVPGIAVMVERLPGFGRRSRSAPAA